MKQNKLEQGDIVWLDFSPSKDNEMRGKHPAVVVSSNAYNQKTNYVMVCPITSHGNQFESYVELEDYQGVHGRINTAQLYSYSYSRVEKGKPIDHLREADMIRVNQLLMMALEIDD